MNRRAISALRSGALFVPGLQPSQEPGAGQVRQAAAAAVRRFGSRGCAGRVAQEFGAHPEAAAGRMRWARQAVTGAFGRPGLPGSVLGSWRHPACGAGYLVYLGVQAIRHRRLLAAALDATVANTSTGRLVRDGIVVGASNPKTIVFFAAVLPQFVTRSAGQVPGQMLVLGAVNLAIAVLCDSGWAVAAGSARAWLARSPRRLELIGGTGGLVMICLGASLALTGRKH